MIYRDSFLSALKKGMVMSGSFWLEKIRTILVQYGFSQEAKNMEEKLRFYQKEDLKNINKSEISIKIRKEKIEDYIKNLDVASLFEALQIIATSFIPDKNQSKEIVLQNARENPFLFRIQGNIIDHNGRKVSKIGPIEEDLDGHVIQQMKLSLQLSFAFIELGLDHLEKSKSLNVDKLLEHLFKSSAFLKEHRQIIKKGLIAYFNKDYISSCSILIPQIETIVRNIITIAEGAVYQQKEFNLRPLGSLLRDEVFFKIFEKFNKNIPIYFQILLTDKGGFNFRNYICHGHFPSNRFNKFVAVFIIHLLLILSTLRKKEI